MSWRRRQAVGDERIGSPFPAYRRIAGRLVRPCGLSPVGEKTHSTTDAVHGDGYLVRDRHTHHSVKATGWPESNITGWSLCCQRSQEILQTSRGSIRMIGSRKWAY